MTRPTHFLWPIGLATLMLAGCAAPVFKVVLDAPPPSGADVVVSDNRLDRAIIMKMSSAYSVGNFTEIDLTPPLTEALKAWISSSRTNTTPVRVRIDALEISYKVGFAKADDLSCGIESSVMVGSGAPKTIRSITRNNENLAPQVSAGGKIILSQCLEQHAKDINAAAQPIPPTTR